MNAKQATAAALESALFVTLCNVKWLDGALFSIWPRAIMSTNCILIVGGAA